MNIGSNVNFLLGLQLQLKINHWQTKSYARHEAFERVYQEFLKLTDKYVEIAMGKNGVFKFNDEEKEIRIVNLSELNLESFIKVVREAIIQFEEQLDESSDADLIGIKDEMLSTINLLSYLLTLK